MIPQIIYLTLVPFFVGFISAVLILEDTAKKFLCLFVGTFFILLSGLLYWCGFFDPLLRGGS